MKVNVENFEMFSINNIMYAPSPSDLCLYYVRKDIPNIPEHCFISGVLLCVGSCTTLVKASCLIVNATFVLLTGVPCRSHNSSLA